jgi:hypothetical protein
MTKTMLKKKQGAKPAPKPRPAPTRASAPKATPKPAPAPDLILFGIPRGGRRAVGARFPTAEAGVARWIARHQGLSVAAANTEALAQLAARLPEWRLKPDGSPLLTILTDALWEELRAVAPPEAERTDQPGEAADGGGRAATAKRRALAEPLWASIVVGDTVLARDFDRDGDFVGWWEAVVLAPADGDSFTLGWRDYPEQGLVRRKRAELAPLHPGGAAPNPAGAASPAN